MENYLRMFNKSPRPVAPCESGLWPGSQVLTGEDRVAGAGTCVGRGYHTHGLQGPGRGSFSDLPGSLEASTGQEGAFCKLYCETMRVASA